MEKQNQKVVNEAIAELQHEHVDPLRTVSITIQLPEGMKDKLERLARLTGHTRSLPHGKGLVGNMSWSCTEAFDFLFAHLDEYQDEKAEELSKALESE